MFELVLWIRREYFNGPIRWGPSFKNEPAPTTVFLLSLFSRLTGGPSKPHIQSLLVPLLAVLKRRDREADHSPPYGTEVIFKPPPPYSAVLWRIEDISMFYLPYSLPWLRSIQRYAVKFLFLQWRHLKEYMRGYWINLLLERSPVVQFISSAGRYLNFTERISFTGFIFSSTLRIQRFVAMFRRDRHGFLSWFILIQSTTPLLILFWSVLLLSFNPRLSLSNGVQTSGFRIRLWLLNTYTNSDSIKVR
jgi:hypothetical protein